MTLQSLKHRCLTYELGLLSLNAALSTRDKDWPIYDSSKKLHQRSKAKSTFRDVLVEIETMYSKGGICDDVHIAFVVKVADELSAKLKDHLHGERFRIGIAQKLVNVHLKYLWVAGLCSEPPHCPIDGIIRDMANISYDWTRSDCAEEYRKAINSLRKVAHPKSLSVWELEAFRRRDDK